MKKEKKIKIAIFISLIIFILVWLNSCGNSIEEKRYSKAEYDSLMMSDSSVIRYTIGDPSDSIYCYGKENDFIWSMDIPPIEKEKDTVIVKGEISVKWVPLIGDSFEGKFGDYLEGIYLVTKTDTFVYVYSGHRKAK